MRPLADGVRAVGIEARKVSMRDILLACDSTSAAFDVDLPLSASVRADVSADGTPQVVQGQFIAEAGTIIDRGKRQTPTENRPRRFSVQLGRAATQLDCAISG